MRAIRGDTQGPSGLKEAHKHRHGPRTASDSLSLSLLLPIPCAGEMGQPPHNSPGPKLHTCRWVQTLLSMSYTLSRESSDTKTY